jgi:thiol-disulfide isomerase/thioredoxin
MKFCLKFNALFIYLALVTLFMLPAHAENFKAFDANSRARIEESNQGRAFVLAFWSVDCPYCIDEMKQLGDVLRQHTQVKLITVCTDATGKEADIAKVLAQAQLPAHERWQFATDDEDRLRYQIDKTWGGELPRSYFYDTRHHIKAISGRPPLPWLNDWLGKNN